MTDVTKFLESKGFKIILFGIGILILGILIFKAGMSVGFREANFSYKWGENYHQNFGGPRQGYLGDFSGRDFTQGHGTFGQILKIDGNNLTIGGGSSPEKIVVVAADTSIERFQSKIGLSDLKVNDNVVVIGEPNDSGQIEAKLIRVMPAPKTSSFLPSFLKRG